MDTLGCDSAAGCATPISLPEQALKNRILKIYPNPFKTELRIETVFSANEELKIKIINPLGLSIKEKKLDNANSVHILNAEDIAPGIYYLQLSDKGKLFAVEKIVKE